MKHSYAPVTILSWKVSPGISINAQQNLCMMLSAAECTDIVIHLRANSITLEVICVVHNVRMHDWCRCMSIRRAANPQKVLYLRSLMHSLPTHLVCNDHPIANFLSFHMSLVVVMNCGAGNALRGFEISMFYFFLKLYFIHISKDILPLWALNAIKQCK